MVGASSGIGAATAVGFAKHGVKVAINGRNAENLEKTAKKCYLAGLKETEVNLFQIYQVFMNAWKNQQK